jgi:hypothetical protein
MKHFAKRREPIVAVQWTGELTPDMTALIGDRLFHVDGDRQLVFGNAKGCGRFACVGDWIVSSSGEDLTVIGNEVFERVYEEVDDTGRSLPPTDAEYELTSRSFVRELDALLVEGLRLSRKEHPNIFLGRDRLLNRVRCLLDDERYRASYREQRRIMAKIAQIVQERTL